MEQTTNSMKHTTQIITFLSAKTSLFGSKPLEPAETRPRSNFVSRKLLSKVQSGTKHQRNVFMAGTEYFGETAQPRIIIWRSTQPKYHRITRKNSAYWKINTERFSYTRLIQVPGYTITRSAVQPRPCFHTKSWPGSPAMLLSPNSFDSQEPVPEAKDLEQYHIFLSQPGSGWLIRLTKWNENTMRYWTMQTLRIVITFSHLRALHDALRETFLEVTNDEMITAKRHGSQL